MISEIQPERKRPLIRTIGSNVKMKVYKINGSYVSIDRFEEIVRELWANPNTPSQYHSPLNNIIKNIGEKLIIHFDISEFHVDLVNRALEKRTAVTNDKADNIIYCLEPAESQMTVSVRRWANLLNMGRFVPLKSVSGNTVAKIREDYRHLNLGRFWMLSGRLPNTIQR